MAAVQDYLKKLLYQYDCVVVPEFGAFLTHHQSATFTESSGLYLPPRRRVAFNEALRLDDGILANYIMLHEPVTREGAQRHIGAFVQEMRQQVETTGRFEIDGIGTFTRNDEGRLQFEPSLRQNFFGEAFGMSALPTRLAVPTPVVEPILEARPVTSGPVRVPNETETEPNLLPMPASRPNWRVAAAAVLIGSLGLVSFLSVVNPGQPLQSSLNPANLFRLPNVTYERIAATFAPSKSVTFPTKPVEKRVAVPAPTVAPVAVKPVTPTPAPVAVAKPAVTPVSKSKPVEAAPVAVAKPVRTGPMYTIFAGSFASKRNAVNLQRRLRKAGYADAYIIPPVVQGKLYKVAAAGTTASDEAMTLQAAVSKFAGVPAFVLKH